jgi:nitrite reductase/ring-hydroxylating ferredoxin subunit
VLSLDGRTIVAVPEHLVAAERDIPEGGGVLVHAGGVEVGVFKVGGRVVAYENRCAHQGGPVCIGEIMGRYEEVLGPNGESVTERFAEDALHIVCPWHGWEYDLATGRCHADGRFGLRRYPVEIRDGAVYLRV